MVISAADVLSHALLNISETNLSTLINVSSLNGEPLWKAAKVIISAEHLANYGLNLRMIASHAIM